MTAQINNHKFLDMSNLGDLLISSFKKFQDDKKDTSRFETIVNDIEKIREGLVKQKLDDITDLFKKKTITNNLKRLKTLDEFINVLFYQQDNGVALIRSDGFSKEIIEKLKKVGGFLQNTTTLIKEVNDEALNPFIDLNPNKEKELKELLEKYKAFEIKGKVGKGQNERIFSVRKNRFFSVLAPQSLTTVADGERLKLVLENLINLMSEAEVKELNIDENLSDNWIENSLLINKIIRNYLGDESVGIKNKGFAWFLYSYFSADFSFCKQIIKYGAPGTGKTFLTKKEAIEFFDYWKHNTGLNFEFESHYKVVQFHPSYTYEDFIEGIRPIGISDGKVVLKLKDGVFKAFCKEAARWELKLYEKGLGLENEGENSFNNLNVAATKEKNLDDDVLFKELLAGKNGAVLLKDLIPPFFFVIDEINRAELSRVFGELMFCLEYRGYPGKVKTQYSELASRENIFIKANEENYFFIPHNVYIIGTMNTIDRSVESFDFALRRRFLWQHLKPNYDVLTEYFSEKGFKEETVKIIDGLEKMNEAITAHPILGEDFQIGHAYLMKLDQYPNFRPKAYKKTIWEKHLKPILEEYFRGLGEGKTEIGNLSNIFFNLEVAQLKD